MITRLDPKDIFMWEAEGIFAKDVKTEKDFHNILRITAERFLDCNLDGLHMDGQQAFAMPRVSFRNNNQKTDVSFSNEIITEDLPDCFNKYDKMEIDLFVNSDTFEGLYRLLYVFNLSYNEETQEIPLDVIGMFKKSEKAWEERDTNLNLAINISSNMMRYGAPVGPNGKI